MSQSAVEGSVGFSQTNDSPIGLQKNSHHLYEASNLSYDFNIGLNKSYDLNKCPENVKVSSENKAILEPFNKFIYDQTNQGKNATRQLSETENLDRLESDESLGILPDLLNDDVTFDAFTTNLHFSDEDTHDSINPEMDKSPASLVFSPPIDNQFNRMSLFLKNISTPLPNFVHGRRYSSTPKTSTENKTESIEMNSSLQFLPDDKEPIIAGSCHIKFETDFNLDDLKNVKSLTSTAKDFSPFPLSSLFNEMSEESDLKSEISFKEKSDTIENNLNVTQTFSDNVEKLFPYECKENIQYMNILNNTFQIKQSLSRESVDAVVSLKNPIPDTMKINKPRANNFSLKEKVKTLDSTFVIPGDEFSCKVDCEKTFVVDFNSTIDTDMSFKSICKDKILNETHVLKMDSIEVSLKQQDQIANTTFTEDLRDDSQLISENHCYGFYGTTFKPLNPICEETFSKNDLNETEDCSENVLQCIDDKCQSTSETFNIKENITFSEKTDKVLPKMNLTQNDSCQIEVASRNSLNAPRSNSFHGQVEEYVIFEENSPTKNENDLSNKTSPFVALQSIIIPKEDCSFEGSKPCVDTMFSEKVDEAECDRILVSIENNEIQKSQNPLEEVSDATFSEEMAENQIELDSTPAGKDKYQTSLKEITDVPFSKLDDKDSIAQHKIHLSQYDKNFADETSNLTNFGINGSNKHNSFKNCSLEPKTIGKSRLLKPTKIVYPRKISEQSNIRLSIPKSFNKPSDDKKSLSSNFNRRLSLFCSKANDDNKSKCKADFKKPFITPILDIKKPGSNFQKSGLDTKYPNTYLKNSTINDDQSLITKPYLSSGNSKNKFVAVTSVNQPVTSRLNLHEKIPLKSLKMKECGLNTTNTYTTEITSDKVISFPKNIDLPRRGKLSETGIKNADKRKNYSRHSIATNMPRKFPLFTNNLNNNCNSKPTAMKENAVSNSITKLKISSLPNVQSYTKNSSNGNENKNVIKKSLASKNKNSSGYQLKPFILDSEAVKCVKSQLSTCHMKQQTNARENAGPNSSMVPTSEAVQALNTLSVKKSKGKFNFLPMSKSTKGNIRTVNSNDMCTVQQTDLQSQVQRQTSGKLPQLRRIPAPCYNK